MLYANQYEVCNSMYLALVKLPELYSCTYSAYAKSSWATAVCMLFSPNMDFLYSNASYRNIHNNQHTECK